MLLKQKHTQLTVLLMCHSFVNEMSVCQCEVQLTCFVMERDIGCTENLRGITTKSLSNRA